jgi:hypothetical protein
MAPGTGGLLCGPHGDVLLECRRNVFGAAMNAERL